MGSDVTAERIKSLLAQKHSKDIFLTECKTGPTQVAGAGMQMIDAWAMPKSWSKPWTTGYEIKVSRQDFLRDDKWHEYQAYCHAFYFVCPPKLITPDELPEGVGLLWTSQNGRRLFTKRKAVIDQEKEIPESLWRYILMWRCVVTDGRGEAFDRSAKTFWKKWLTDKEIDHNFGTRVGVAIRQRVEERILEVERENEKLKRKHARYDMVRSQLEAWGFDPDEPPVFSYQIERQLRDISCVVPRMLPARMHSLSQEAKKVSDALEELVEKAEKENSGAS